MVEGLPLAPPPAGEEGLLDLASPSQADFRSPAAGGSFRSAASRTQSHPMEATSLPYPTAGRKRGGVGTVSVRGPVRPRPVGCAR